ncbi:hypothetical protein KKF11_00860 [Patescibacteria group bacterium]|nr:hypothetical protein [Patescibacteria group bacterium]
MKIKSGHLTIFGFLLVFSLASFIFGLKINYPPQESELVILANAKISSSQVHLKKEARREILQNLLGQDQYNKEKLFFLRSKLQMAIGAINLAGLRIANFFLLNAALAAFYFFLKQVGWQSKIALTSLLFLLISPLFLSLWLFQPKFCLAIFLIFLWLYLYFREKLNLKENILFAAILPALFFTSFQGLVIGLLILTPLTLFKFYQTKKCSFFLILSCLTVVLLAVVFKSPAFKNNLTEINIYNAIRLEQTSQQIDQRVTAEDSLQTKVSFPLWFRRMGYNKVFFAYRNIGQEVLSFFDLETLFFQEVHPTHQKSEVVFFWPEVFLFLFGILVLIKEKLKKKEKILLMLLLLSLLFYLSTSSASISEKHSLTFFALAIIIAKGFEKISKKLSLLIIPLLLWAVLINAYDIFKRPLFWYDNRPFVYSEGMKTLKEKNLESVKNIHLTSLVGNPKIYYFYFFSPDPEIFLPSQTTIKDQGRTIYFESFDLSDTNPQEKSLYFGFLGEFIGSEPFNKFDEEDIEKIKSHNLKIEKVWKLDNTIAFRYSDYFILASRKN